MLKIIQATPKDTELILSFIKKLAEYEQMLDEVSATPELLNKWIFEEKKAEVLLAYYDNSPVGFALYFYNFSTFVGKCGIYLEDIFVDVDYRGKGIGKALFKAVATKAYENGFERMDWVCLTNNYPSLEFYKKIGAKELKEWQLLRLDKNAICNLALEK